MFGTEGEEAYASEALYENKSGNPAENSAKQNEVPDEKNNGSSTSQGAGAAHKNPVQNIPPAEIPVVPEKEYVFPPYRLLKKGTGAGISKTELQR